MITTAATIRMMAKTPTTRLTEITSVWSLDAATANDDNNNSNRWSK